MSSRFTPRDAKTRGQRPHDETQTHALRHALDLAIRESGLESRWALRLRETIADRLHASGASISASNEMELVINARRRLRQSGVALADSLTGVGDMYLVTGRYHQALEAYEEAFSMAGGRGNEITDFTCRYGMGRALVALTRWSEAVPVITAAYDWYVARYGDRGPMASELREMIERGNGALA